MARKTPKTESRALSPVTPLPENEAEFLRVLRARALSSVELHTSDPPDGLTQLELENQAAMSRPSIINLVKHFRPVLVEQRGEGVRAGRVALDPGAGIAVGVEIGHDSVGVATADLHGRMLEPSAPRDYVRRAGGAIEEADATLDWIESAVERRLIELDRRPDEVVGVGISVAGPVDRNRGVLRTPHFRTSADGGSDWELLGVRDHLRRRLGWAQVPFMLDNDANLSALAEFTWGAARAQESRSYQNVIYLDWSHGLGAGLILGGELYRGAGVAGEIGHAVIQSDGPRCASCGNCGCLEVLTRWPALARDIPTAHDPASAIRLAQAGDPAARQAFEAAADHVARALGPLISVLNPDMVLIGGTVGQQGFQVVRTPLLRALKRYTMRPALQDVEVAAATLKGPTSLQGAIALVLRTPRDEPDQLVRYLQRKALRARHPA